MDFRKLSEKRKSYLRNNVNEEEILSVSMECGQFREGRDSTDRSFEENFEKNFMERYEK
jgi:hypothetical protein